MPILTATNLKHTYGHRLILDGISLSVEPGERMGIVGRNGCGKSTFIKCLEGIVTPDYGDVALGKGVRSGYMQQDPVFGADETLRSAAETAFAELHELHRQLDAVFGEMETAEGEKLDRLLKKQERLEQEMNNAGGYSIDHKIDSILHGLGFTDAQFSIPVLKLSGGQKSRLALAIALLQEPDILLLDEPTNHLDIEGRIWLENFLKDQFKGAVVMISHDRYLLDNVVGRIIEIEDGRLIDYPGNYEAFREIRAQRRLTQKRAFENQQTFFKKEQAFIDRYRAGQRAKQAQGRLSKLTRMQDQRGLDRPMEMDSMRLSLPKAERTGDIVISAREISKSYTRDDGTVLQLFKNFDLIIGKGERWGIIGPNGSGKSTLIRMLLKELDPDSGVVVVGSNVRVGYYRQSQEHIDLERTVSEYLQDVILKEVPGATFSEQQARDLAGAFLFSGSEQEKKLQMLSGGERTRAVLAGLIASAKNVMVMDEPTNHLDIPSSERLEGALLPPDEESKRPGYEGVLLLISHDRALIDATCDHLLILDGKGGVYSFTGNYSEWHEKNEIKLKEAAAEEAEAKSRAFESEKRRKSNEVARADAGRQPAKPAPGSGGGGSQGGQQLQGSGRSDNRNGNNGNNGNNGSNGNGNGNAHGGKPAAAQQPAERTKKPSNPFVNWTVERIDTRIKQNEARIKQIDEDMASGDVWRDPAKCDKLGAERTKLTTELEPLEYEYLNRNV